MRKCGCHSHGGFILSPEGLAQRERQLDAFRSVGLTRSAQGVRLDKLGSVSASEAVTDLYEFVSEDMTEDQYRRFHNGS